MDSNSPSGRQALGRGLAALIPGNSSNGQAARSGLRTIAIEQIDPNPTQPRKQFDGDQLDELAASIREHGVLQPVVVRRAGERYQLVAGERRWRATAKAGLHEIPALVKELADDAALAVALVENVQRQDLDPIEEAEAYHRLVSEHALSHEELARIVGKSRATITNALRLLQLPAPVLARLATGELTAGHARAVMTLKDPAAMERLADEIVRQRLSVRDAERRAKAQKASEADSNVTQGDRRSAAERDLEERLQRALGTKVRLLHRNGKGRIEVVFHSLEHLEQITDQIVG
ncbi:MAG: ParB/RepB/Spo0J family partition protein [Myxococcota bacterium]